MEWYETGIRKVEEELNVEDPSAVNNASITEKEYLETVQEKVREETKKRFVSLGDVCKMLGFRQTYRSEYESFNMKNIGWGGSEPGLHYATFRDLHPDCCPYCGRSWDD